jgi:hypothetical protein
MKVTNHGRLELVISGTAAEAVGLGERAVRTVMGTVIGRVIGRVIRRVIRR